MAIKIPRAQQAQVVETVAPEAVQQDYSGLGKIGQQITQVGTQLRKNQESLDLAEANTRIYAAQKAAKAYADEAGLYGKDYTDYMSNALAKARDEVQSLTELPEVRRTLSNDAMQKKQADAIQFQAEGLRRQIQNDKVRIAATVDMNAKAAQHDFHWAGGSFSEDAFELAQNAKLAAMSETGATDDVRTLSGQKASSTVLFRAGVEVIEGYTRNGQGDPGGLLNALIDKDGNILRNRITENMTDEDVWNLKRLAEQKISSIRSASVTMAESHTKRINEMSTNMTAKIERGEYVPPDSFALLAAERDGLQAVVASTDDLRFGAFGKNEPRYEGWRQTINKANEMAVMGAAYKQGQDFTVNQLDQVIAAIDVYQRSGQWPEGTPIPVGPIDDMVKAKSGAMLNSAEKEMVYSYKLGLVNARNMPKAAAEKGEAVVEYMKTAERTETITNYARITGSNFDTVVDQTEYDMPMQNDAAYIDATLPADPADMNGYLRKGVVRSDYLTEAEKKLGVTPTLYSKVESEALVDAYYAGDVGSGELVEVFNLIGQQPDNVQREQMKLMSGLKGSEHLLAYATATDNMAYAGLIAKGALLQSTEFGDPGTLFEAGNSGIGGMQQAEDDLKEMLALSFPGQGPAIQERLYDGYMPAYVGSLKKPKGNKYKKSELEAVAAGIFPNGATFSNNGRMYPNATDVDYGTIEKDDFLPMIDGDDFNGDVLPKLNLKDDVQEWAMGGDGEDRIAEMIRDGDALLEPVMDKPGAYYVFFKKGSVPVGLDIYNGSRHLIDANGVPLELDFNNYFSRKAKAFGDDALDDVKSSRRSGRSQL